MTASFIGSFDNGASASGTVLTVSATYAAGEHVFIRCTRGSAGTTETVTDGTNTYTQIGSSVTAGSGDVITHYECVSAAAGTFTVAQTLGTAASFRGIQGLRYTGLSGSSTHVGQNQVDPGTGTDATTSGNLTPSSQPGLLIGWSYDFNGTGSAAGTGFTSRSTFPTEAGANGSASRAEDKRLTSTAAAAATFTTSGATGNVITSAIWCMEPFGALDFSGGDATNPNNDHYEVNGPPIQDGSFAFIVWFRCLSAPAASTVLFATPLNPNSNEGVSAFLYNAVTPANQIAAYGNGNGSGGSTAMIDGATVPPFDGTDICLVVQRNGTNFERYMVAKGGTVSAPDQTRAWVGTGIAAGIWKIGAYWNSTLGWIFPLGEFAFLATTALTAAEVTTIAAGVRPTAENVGEDPLILFGFRGDGTNPIEVNLGSGGAVYDAVRVGNGFSTTTEFFTVGTTYLDFQIAGWTPTPYGHVSNVIDDGASTDDTDYVTSPLLRSAAEELVLNLVPALIAGDYTIQIRAKSTSSTGNLRVRFLNSSGADVGVTSIQGITTTLTTYSLSVTLTDTATQVQIEVTT